MTFTKVEQHLQALKEPKEFLLLGDNYEGRTTFTGIGNTLIFAIRVHL